MDKKYRVEVSFTFKGTVDIIAGNVQQARQIVANSFGCVRPSYHESSSAIDDWKTSIHPEETRTGKIKRLK